jgi:hypothetical protein
VGQELQQLLPCAEWAPHGFPSVPGEGWLGDDRLWDLDVGGLGARLYLAGDEPSEQASPADVAATLRHMPVEAAAWPGTARTWISFEVGPEQFQPATSMLRWEVTEWDVTVPS